MNTFTVQPFSPNGVHFLQPAGVSYGANRMPVRSPFQGQEITVSAEAADALFSETPDSDAPLLST